MKIEKKNISELIPAEYNPRKDLQPGDPEYEKLRRSINEFGYVEPVIWNKTTGRVVGGHQRLKVLKDMGHSEIDCVVVELDEEKEKALNVALNKISGSWDSEKLASLLSELNVDDFDVTLTGFDMDEIADLLKDEADKVHEDDFDIDPVLSKDAVTQKGDIWIMGKHRLICGDSTDASVLNRVLEGKAADMMETDPPYNIDYGGTIAGDGRDIANDNMSEEDFYKFLLSFYKACEENLKPGAPVYIFHSTKESVNFIQAMIDAGFKYAQTLVWYKNHFTLGRQDYQWIHEPILYGWKEGAAHFFINDRALPTVFTDKALNLKKMGKQELVELLEKVLSTPTSVIIEEKPRRNAEHPTMKPIALCARVICNSSKPGETVLDPFGGSGSTLIACEQIGRRCCTSELDEHYCDVIVNRYIELVGSDEDVFLLRGNKKIPYKEAANG